MAGRGVVMKSASLFKKKKKMLIAPFPVPKPITVNFFHLFLLHDDWAGVVNAF